MSRTSNVDIIEAQNVLGSLTMRNIVQGILIQEGLGSGPQFVASTLRRMRNCDLDAIVDSHDDDHISIDIIVDLPRPKGHPLIPKWFKRS